MTHDSQRVRADSNIMSAGSLLCATSILRQLLTRPIHYVYKNILLLKQCLWRCATKLQGSCFCTHSVCM